MFVKVLLIIFMMPDFGSEVGRGLATGERNRGICYKFLSAHEPEKDILIAIASQAIEEYQQESSHCRKNHW